MGIAGIVWQTGPALARTGVGLVLVLPWVWAERTAWRARLAAWPVRLAMLMAFALILAGAVRSTASSREEITAQVWGEWRQQQEVFGLAPGFADSLKRTMGEDPAAFAGLHSSYQWSTGNWSGRELYVPVSRAPQAPGGTFRWGMDDRSKPDHAAWLERFEQPGGPRWLVVVHNKKFPAVLEAAWATHDTARFTRFAVSGRDTVYRVRVAVGQ